MKSIFKEWQEIWVPEFKPRMIDHSLFFPKKIRKIISFTGCRRVGKTYLMFQLIDFLATKIEKENIFYINFEDERIERDVKTVTNILPNLIELYGEKNFYLFLDEVHVMPKWDVWLRRIYDTYRNINLFISGSSSKLSSKELPYALRGRTLNFEVFPLSFKEFLFFKNFKIEKDFEYSGRKKAVMKRFLQEYLFYGGFPEIILEDDERKKRQMVQEYFRTIIVLDLGERYKIRNISILSDFLKLLLNSTSFSVNKVYNTLKSGGKKVGKESLINYSRYLEEIYFCYFIPIFSYKIKDQLQYMKKVYFADNSFINLVGLKFSKDSGREYENVVALKLIKDFGRENIFYWKNRQGREADFVIRQGLEVKKIVQVCYNINEAETKKRELKSLIEASKELGCGNLLVITEDYDRTEKYERKKIRFIPLWKWLIE